MKIRFAVVITLFGAFAIGCQGQSSTVSDVQKSDSSVETNATNEPTTTPAGTNITADEVIVEEKTASKVAENSVETDSTANANEQTYWTQVTKLYESAKSSGQTTASNVNTWIIETYDQASSSTKETAAATADWFNDAYQQAKESGETTAANTRDWLIEDVKKMGSWEYKTIKVSTTDSDGALEQLNELGSKRWECFWVDKQDAQTVFYLKKSGRSYLRQLPARELLRLLPLLNKGDSIE